MELQDIQFRHVQKAATETVELVAGNKFRIQKWNPADGIVDVLAEVTVPAGKAWAISIVVDISETDA